MMSNRYCERVGLAAVPCVEELLNKDKLNLFQLMFVALLEQGRPMMVEEIAERLTEAGAVAESGDMVLSLKKAWHGREPICRDPEGRLALNLSSSELERTLWRINLRPPRFPAAEPAPEPVQPGDEVPLTEVELTAAFRGRGLYGFSASRQAAAVLDARAKPMTVEEIDRILAEMTSNRFPFAADRVRFWQSTLVSIDGNGSLALDCSSPDLGAMRRAVRKRARPVLRQQARHEQWATVQKEQEPVRAEQRLLHAQEVARLRRAIIHAVPEAKAPLGIALLDVGARSIHLFGSGELASIADALANYDLLVGLHVRETLYGLDLDPDCWRLVDLKPPQKSRRLSRSGRTLEITPELLISSTTGNSRPLGDPARIAQYFAEGDAGKLSRRLESDVKALYAFYQYGVLHNLVRLRWGFLDEMLSVDWALPGDMNLHEFLEGAMKAAAPVDFIVGSAPGWAEPWSRARRGYVLKIAPWQVMVKIDSMVARLDLRDIQAVRLAEGPNTT